MRDKLGGQTMKEFVVLKANTYSYLKKTTMKIKKQKAQKSVS